MKYVYLLTLHLYDPQWETSYRLHIWASSYEELRKIAIERRDLTLKEIRYHPDNEPMLQDLADTPVEPDFHQSIAKRWRKLAVNPKLPDFLNKHCSSTHPMG